MEKRLLNIEQLKPNLILSNDIYNYNTDTILYTKGTVLTLEKIERLKRFGNVSVLVDDKQEIIKNENNIDIIRRTVEADFNKIYECANQILTSVLVKEDVRNVLGIVDEGIHDHSYKVALLSTIIGMNLENFDKNQLEQLAITALLHDIGKSTIDVSILNKPGKLTKEEYEIIKQHSQSGYDILSSTNLFNKNICNGVLSHHENEDGTGYPNCLSSSNIPLFSKIIHICDVYSALTTKRCYKEPWSYEATIVEFNNSSKKYDKDLLEILKMSLPFYLKDDVVLLSTEDLATVVNIYKYGLLVKIFGTNECIRIDNREKNSVYIKRKIKTR